MAPGRKGAAQRGDGNPSGMAIGFAIRSKRRELGMTLRQLADASGLSAPFLSQAERGHSVPSIVSLIALSKAMGTDIGYFVDPPKAGHAINRADAPDYIELGSPVRYTRLSGHFPGRQMECLLIDLPPALRAPVVTRDGEGFYLILEGTVTFTVGDVDFVLDAGDSTHFDQRMPHSMINEGDDTARMLWTGTPPLFDT